jgi:preprotein translocase subunit SecG
MILPLAAVPFVMKIVAAVWIIVAVVLILLVLIQKGRGGGLAGAFGGAGANSLMGTKTGDFLTWVTIGLVVLFLFLAVIMAKYYRPAASTGLEAPMTPGSQTTPAMPTTPQGSETEEPTQAIPAQPETPLEEGAR